jgi:hypothetical protein
MIVSVLLVRRVVLRREEMVVGCELIQADGVGLETGSVEDVDAMLCVVCSSSWVDCAWWMGLV